MIKVMPSSMMEAVRSAISAVDNGDFKKTIRLISYVEAYMPEYDPVFVQYMYLITYQNLGESAKAKSALEKLRGLKVNNPQMVEVINSISSELENVDSDEIISVDMIIKQLFMSQQDVDFYASEFDFYRPLRQLSSSRSEEDEVEVLKLYSVAQGFFDDYKKAIDSLDHHIKPTDDHNLWVILKAVKENMFFWALFEKSDFEAVLKDKNIDRFYKSFIISSIMKLRFLPCISWPDFTKFGYEDEFHEQLVDDINVIMEDLPSLYDTGDDDDFDIVYSIVEIIVVDIFPRTYHEAFDYKKLIAIIGYLYNYMIVGTQYDLDVYKLTDVKKVTVQSKVDYYFELITFLIS